VGSVENGCRWGPHAPKEKGRFGVFFRSHWFEWRESSKRYMMHKCSRDIGVSANQELVDKFCYLGDMLGVDRNANAAVETRIRIGWNKFRQLVPLLTNKDIVIVRRRLYSGCVCSSMLHGSETWPVRKKMRWHFRGQR